MWASVERGILVVGPPGSGKGLHLAINAILDAPGPVVTTSTKPDNLKTTLTARDALGQQRRRYILCTDAGLGGARRRNR